MIFSLFVCLFVSLSVCVVGGVVGAVGAVGGGFLGAIGFGFGCCCCC